MSDEVLSQDEISALLEENDTEDQVEQSEEVSLSPLEKDAIGEVANISMGSAATALYGLLDQKVEITAPEVSLSTINQLVDSYVRPCILVDVQYVEGLQGSNQLIVETEDAAIIADLMMGGDGTEPPGELSELHISAVGEAMNQMMGSAATSMSDFFAGNKINISPPNAELLELSSDDVNLKGISGDDQVVQVAFDMHIGDLIDSQIVQIMTMDFAKQLVEGMMGETQEEEVEAEEVTSKPEQSQQPQQQSSSQEPPSQQPQQQQMQQTQQQQSQPQMQRQPQQRQQQPSSMSPQPDVEVEGVEFEQLGGQLASDLNNDLSLIYDVPLELTVRLGKSKMSIKEILDLGPGSVIELDRLAGEAVDLLVNGKLIAKGEVVVIDENFGFRVTDIVSAEERLKKL
ncbi:flagellar motor switch phosphatase FliY [Natroniella sulfidigena]|uniref:flagellar motor switch phosphatase FliY n=1 Tax=Natroniella sulfidigena TaxID=723921 RepID=UPI00200A0550|nr:flagellar motor switch phosphatase FliY [Natroniella sulfidigena]MCK8816519.1 flagellar motor switch phosphatase FliY [Natroniella sulfidigena]